MTSQRLKWILLEASFTLDALRYALEVEEGCTCDPQAYDLGPEGQRRYFEDRYCPTHGEEAMAVCMCVAVDVDSGERSWRPCPSDLCERPSHHARHHGESA